MIFSENRFPLFRIMLGLLSTHRDASRCEPKDWGHPPIEWELSNPRFNGQKRSKINAIAIDTIGQRYGPATALSTRPDVSEFMILTDFSRCQALMIGRVSPPPHKTPCLDKDFA
jgi:hypothetical protein